MNELVPVEIEAVRGQSANVSVQSGASKPLGREKWRGRRLETRLRAMKSLWIDTSYHTPVLEYIDAQSKFIDSSGESAGVLVVCESGGGKTALCRELKRRLPDIRLSDRTIRQMVLMKIPSHCSSKQLATSLLEAMGDPASNTGTAKQQTERAMRLLHTAGVKLLVVDNFQDIPERRSTGTVRIVGNWFRSLIDGSQITFVALGTEKAKRVRIANDQVRRRVMAVRHIPYFSVDTPQAIEEWMRVLRRLDARLPLAESSGLGEPRLAARLFFASNGIFAYLIRLLKRAIAEAISRGSEKLLMEHLRLAYAFNAGDVSPGGNPFEARFAGRPLDRANELFFRMERAAEHGEGEAQHS